MVQFLDKCLANHRISRFYPRLKATGQWTHAGKAQLLELQRHTGAGGLARSSAVQNQIAVLGNLRCISGDFLRLDAERARKSARIVQKIQRMAQIHDR